MKAPNKNSVLNSPWFYVAVMAIVAALVIYFAKDEPASTPQFYRESGHEGK